MDRSPESSRWGARAALSPRHGGSGRAPARLRAGWTTRPLIRRGSTVAVLTVTAALTVCVQLPADPRPTAAADLASSHWYKRFTVRSYTAGPASSTPAWALLGNGLPSRRPRPTVTGPSTSTGASSPHPTPSVPRTSGPAPTSTATTAAPPGSSTPPSRACVANAMGLPGSGAYVGAAVGGTQTLPGVEGRTGTLAIRRDYYRADQVDFAISRVEADLAAGRLPWISFKLPLSWADMAAGKGDAWADDLVDKLARVGGPVWLAFHHEPEGDGTMADWTRMQQHLAPIVHARSDNIAYTIITTAWDNFFGPSQYAMNTIWPGDQYVDVLGYDVYNEYGAKATAKMLDLNAYFSAMGGFARAHHVDWAIGETAYTAAAAGVDPSWLRTEYAAMLAQGGKALTYFDSSLNSIADWTLDDAVRLGDFTKVLGQSLRIC
jgi:hypothetical protein